MMPTMNREESIPSMQRTVTGHARRADGAVSSLAPSARSRRQRAAADRRDPDVSELAGPRNRVAGALAAIRGLTGHAFWLDSISLVDSDLVDAGLLSSHGRVTDSYLLALARANKGRLATLDQKLATEVVDDGAAVLLLI